MTTIAAKAVSSGPFLISTRPPGPRQLRLARLVRLALLGALLVTLGYRHTQLARLDSFVPVANAVVGLNDLLTAILLYAQFSLTRARALLALASGFLLKTLVLIPHAVTFPGVFATNGLLGAPMMQMTAWLYPAQQVGFGLCAVAYTILDDRERLTPSDDATVLSPIIAAIAATVAVAVALTWILIAEASHLPRLIAADGVHMSEGFRRVGVELMLVAGLGSIVVLRRRPKSMIELWLQVAIWSWLLEAIITTVVPARFSLAFYVNRGMGMVSSSFVLVVLLSESAMLHRQLVRAMAAREQERVGHRTAMDILVESLAHELRQPLAAIFLNGQAGAVMAAALPSEHEDVGAAFTDISASARRANEIIDSVRTAFAHSPRDQVTLDVNDLVRQVVDLLRSELDACHVTLALELAPELPTIRGQRGQLTQVLMNGVKNSVESLATIADRVRRLCIRTESLEPDGIRIRIEDSGRGLDAVACDRVFEPFYSTKKGTGLGLPICRSIIEGHEGTISLLPGSPHGAILQVELPTLAPVELLDEPVAAGSGAVGTNSAASILRPAPSSPV